MKNLLTILCICSIFVSRSQTVKEVYEECIKQNVLAPVIVTAQSVLEAGWALDSHNARELIKISLV